MQPEATRNLICSAVPLDVALAMAQAASFITSNSPCARMFTRVGMRSASITCWSCFELPAVMLESVQQTSFWMDSELDDLRRYFRRGSTPWSSTSCVWKSSPVAMLPTTRSAGVCTGLSWCMRRPTSSGQAPASMRTWILRLSPSEMYDRAQQASWMSCVSEDLRRSTRGLTAGWISCIKGAGLPRNRLEMLQVALRRRVALLLSRVSSMRYGITPCART
mmetsp:Transcript_20155/g.77162  ORF Transcript_20155/g.77162 Transcript_20155/m.77162 type:complete len:220 (+) Transcript_20155:486-1145(+)